MANALTNFSNIIIPLLIFYVVAYGIISKCNVYEDFIKGAKDGLYTVIKIIPTLIALMVGVGILRASGFLNFLGNVAGKAFGRIGISTDIFSLIIVKLFSGSAATGLAIDIFKTHGTDSVTGMTASILCSCTETVFYTMSLYYMTVKITKTRWTLAGALLSTLAGVIASIILGKMV
ncbi:MAG: spore maturation protein [Lachnospiraceae bacterium]|nr:spore maturation protein [Lachnospiraceae bacterium]